MLLNEHSNLKGKHSIFSPSNPAFFNYETEDFYDRLMGKYRTALGTELHDWAATKIQRFHKVNSLKEMVNSIDEFIFYKYSDAFDASRLLTCFRYVSKNNPEVLETLRSYINDAIGYKMFTEVVLYYTADFFGTADALIFNDDVLRIHDLKTGSSPAHIEQLLGYAALFCLEYQHDPKKLGFELRIYQNNDILLATPSGDDVKLFIDKYVAFNKIIGKQEGGRS